MAIVERKRDHGKKKVYFVVFRWQGKPVWEKSGADRRDAERLHALRKREVKDGTYLPDGERVATTVGQYGPTWADARKVANADGEGAMLRHYVWNREWFTSLPIAEVEPKHLVRLIEELKVTPGIMTKRQLAPKTVSTIYGVLVTMFSRASFDRIIKGSPCVDVPKGTVSNRALKRKELYTADEIATVLRSESISPVTRVWFAIAIYTGMRQGEVCGRRWNHYDTETKPLGSLVVDTQYDGKKLKTAEHVGEAPRLVPIHPELARILDWWRCEGWELVYRRKPTENDFIVPGRDFTPQTKNASYGAFRRALDKVGVKNHSVHSTRHTFISLARRGGARKDVVEKITHNAKGDVLDGYTQFDFEPLCEAVLCVRIRPPSTESTRRFSVDAIATEAKESLAQLGHVPGLPPGPSGNLAEAGDSEGGDDPPKPRTIPQIGADRAASQRFGDSEEFDAVAALPPSVTRTLESRGERPSDATLGLAKCLADAYAGDEAACLDGLALLARTAGGAK